MVFLSIDCGGSAVLAVASPFLPGISGLARIRRYTQTV